jgi:hypothetical protein
MKFRFVVQSEDFLDEASNSITHDTLAHFFADGESQSGISELVRVDIHNQITIGIRFSMLINLRKFRSLLYAFIRHMTSRQRKPYLQKKTTDCGLLIIKQIISFYLFFFSL